MEKKCKVEGCEGKATTKGYCGKHYKRFVRQGNPRYTEKESHGMSYTPEYTVWKNMRSRCYNKNSKYYSNYGGRNITVCDRWRDSFINFFKDMGLKPEGKTEIDRIDNNGNYEPSNCKWVTPAENCHNRRSTILTIEKVRAIRLKHSQGIRDCDLAMEYSCSQSSIYCVVRNISWKEVIA